MKQSSSLIAVAIALTPTVSLAHTYAFSGVLQGIYKSVSGTGSFVSNATISGLSFSNGQHFEGSFTYDASVPPSPYDTPSDGLQIFAGGVTDFQFRIIESGIVVSAASGSVSLSAGTVPPIFISDSIGFFAPLSSRPFVNSQVYLSSPSNNVFADYALPNPIPLDRLTYRSLYYEHLNTSTNEFLNFRSPITSISVVTAVPEPASIVLLVAGVAVVYMRKRAGA